MDRRVRTMKATGTPISCTCLGGVVTAGGVVELLSPQTRQLAGDNNVEVDCMMCHANQLQTGQHGINQSAATAPR